MNKIVRFASYLAVATPVFFAGLNTSCNTMGRTAEGLGKLAASSWQGVKEDFNSIVESHRKDPYSIEDKENEKVLLYTDSEGYRALEKQVREREEEMSGLEKAD